MGLLTGLEETRRGERDGEGQARFLHFSQKYRFDINSSIPPFLHSLGSFVLAQVLGSMESIPESS